MNINFEEEMAEYEADCEPEQPPCHEEIIVPLFDIVKDGKVLDNGTFLMPDDLIKSAYPEISEEDLELLLEYLDTAESYCEDVCDPFSEKYGVPFVPRSEEAQQDVSRIVKLCQKKYTWLQEEQIRQILETTCWLSNR